MNILITGGAGFIGSHLADTLVENNNVVVIDNLSLGSMGNIKHLNSCTNFTFIESDLSNTNELKNLFNKYRFHKVYHLAANSDIQAGSLNPNIDFTDTFLTTINILDCMRDFGVKKLFFSSTSAVYGEKENQLIHENMGPLLPISYYGGAKLASESFISAYTHMNELETIIFRFPNVIGSRLTHGVIFDFIRKLKKNPKELEILGDGTQSKPYLYIEDLIRGILCTEILENRLEYYNIGVTTKTTVTHIADIVCEKMGLKQVNYKYTGGNIGWKGDIHEFQYDLSKIHATGWKAKYNSNEAVAKTVEEVLEDDGCYISRG